MGEAILVGPSTTVMTAAPAIETASLLPVKKLCELWEENAMKKECGGKNDVVNPNHIKTNRDNMTDSSTTTNQPSNMANAVTVLDNYSCACEDYESEESARAKAMSERDSSSKPSSLAHDVVCHGIEQPDIDCEERAPTNNTDDAEDHTSFVQHREAMSDLSIDAEINSDLVQSCKTYNDLMESTQDTHNSEISMLDDCAGVVDNDPTDTPVTDKESEIAELVHSVTSDLDGLEAIEIYLTDSLCLSTQQAGGNDTNHYGTALDKMRQEQVIDRQLSVNDQSMVPNPLLLVTSKRVEALAMSSNSDEEVDSTALRNPDFSGTITLQSTHCIDSMDLHDVYEKSSTLSLKGKKPKLTSNHLPVQSNAPTPLLLVTSKRIEALEIDSRSDEETDATRLTASVFSGTITLESTGYNDHIATSMELDDALDEVPTRYSKVNTSTAASDGFCLRCW